MRRVSKLGGTNLIVHVANAIRCSVMKVSVTTLPLDIHIFSRSFSDTWIQFDVLWFPHLSLIQLTFDKEPPPSSEPEDISVVITYTQTSTFTTTDPDKYGIGYVTTKPFADKASRLEYVSYLQSESPNYSDVVSSSVVVRLPPPDNGGSGGGGGSSSPLGVRDYVIIAIAAIFALGIFIRECMKRDKYAEGVAETGPRQHPLEETDDLEENDGSALFPVIPEESSDEDDEDDDDEEKTDDRPIGITEESDSDDDDPFGPKEGRRSKLHEE